MRRQGEQLGLSSLTGTPSSSCQLVTVSWLEAGRSDSSSFSRRTSSSDTDPTLTRGLRIWWICTWLLRDRFECFSRRTLK